MTQAADAEATRSRLVAGTAVLALGTGLLRQKAAPPIVGDVETCRPTEDDYGEDSRYRERPKHQGNPPGKKGKTSGDDVVVMVTA